ncbi:MAG TPA: restriction endonuclease, partial [Ktedonobacterales bacterium]
GRGAKPHLVSPTEKLRNELLIPTMEAVKTAIGPHYKKLVRMRLDEILKDLSAEDTGIKGIALEALSFYLTRLLDLTFVKWRYRSNQTGGTEVDVLVEGARLIFSRWQIQCKNTSQANVDDVAKEVGIATAMRTNVIMFVCNGKIGSSIHKFARTVMENTSIQIILLDHSHLEQIQASPADITAILNEQARQTMEIKRSQIQDK